MIELTFSEAPPSVNNLYANHPGGRHLTSQAKAWRLLAGHELNRQAPSYFAGPVAITIAIADTGRRDLDNCSKCIIDLLVGFGVIDADRRDIVRQVHLGWSDKVPGCYVRIDKPEDVELAYRVGEPAYHGL